MDGKELPRLVYVSREKRPGYQHHKKAGAMNAMVSWCRFYLHDTIQVRLMHSGIFMIWK